MENQAFHTDESPIVNPADSRENIVRAESDTTNDIVPFKPCSCWKNYRWRMRHYFYLHLSLFFTNSLFCALIIWLIEHREVPFIDCWFISATCVFTCGLQTYEFPSFSLPSQIILLLFTLISGITVSTIPAVLIKVYRLKRESTSNEEQLRENSLPIRKFLSPSLSSDPILSRHLQSLPTPYELRLKSYLILICSILCTCLFIYISSFLSIALWLRFHYDPNVLNSDNSSDTNPFYAALVISITSFNQNGLSIWKSSLNLFVTDVFMNIVIMLVVMSGTSLFPAILRSVVSLCKTLAPWKYKIFFDYILLNNHRLSTVIFPSVQTRVYVMITILLQILGVTVAMILDYNNPALAIYDGGQRFMIFMFQTANTRFGGYATINISDLSAATLLIFVLLMSIKPQMLCAIDETPFEMEWILIQTQQTLESQVSVDVRRPSIDIFLPFNRMKDFLVRQRSLTRAQAKQYFALQRRTDRFEETIQQWTERRFQHRLSAVLTERPRSDNHGQISLLRMKLFFITCSRHVILSFFRLLSSTWTWLFIFIFLICIFEAPRMTPNNPTITVFRVVFEVISAFGGCGLSMGLSATAPSLAAVLTVSSKIALILVMCLGRHRGLLDSMKDQEEIEYSAQTIIDSWRQLTIYQYQQKHSLPVVSLLVTSPTLSTPPISTRF